MNIPLQLLNRHKIYVSFFDLIVKSIVTNQSEINHTSITYSEKDIAYFRTNHLKQNLQAISQNQHYLTSIFNSCH